jgi:hypothetical protein
MPKGSSPDKRQPVKIHKTALDTARALSGHVAAHGWQSIGVDRSDLPTIAAIIEAAIQLLADKAQLKTKGKSK